MLSGNRVLDEVLNASSHFVGIVLTVIGAVFLYGSSANSPQELCEALAGCGAPAAKDSVADKASLVDAEGGVGSDDEEARGSGAPSATPATK